jgi:tripartite-type tricarboxylate transporter receptor subunit TctC
VVVVENRAGAGSGSHMNGERFKLATGIAATRVGFKGSSDAQKSARISRKR